MRTMKFVIAATLLVALAIPAAANASYDRVEPFRSPSGAVHCWLEQDTSAGGNGAVCAVPSTARNGLTREYDVRDHGHAHVVKTDNVWFGRPEGEHSMSYGTTWAMVGGTVKIGPLKSAVNCTSRRTGLTCRNRNGHGFSLSRERQRVF